MPSHTKIEKEKKSRGSRNRPSSAGRPKPNKRSVRRRKMGRGR